MTTEPRAFERWADEGGVRIRFEERTNGSIVVTISNMDGVVAEATLANFRVDHLKRFLAGESVQPY